MTAKEREDLDRSLACLGVEERIAVKAELIRVGLLQNAAESLPQGKCGHCGQILTGGIQRCSNDGYCCKEGQPEPVAPVEAKEKPSNERKQTIPREVAHALWVEGGYLRMNLNASLELNPENWHESSLKQRLAKWDEAAGRYFDFAISFQSSNPAQPDSSSISTEQMPKPVEIVGNHWIHRERDDKDAKFYRRDEIDAWLKGLK